MPLYEYRCTSCGYSFEKIQKFSDAPEQVCPKCAGVLVRPVTAPALRFEGSGWYVNDYAGKGGAKAGAEGGGSEGSEGSGAKDSKDAKAAPADGGSSAAASPTPASTTAAPSTSSTPSGASSSS